LHKFGYYVFLGKSVLREAETQSMLALDQNYEFLISGQDYLYDQHNSYYQHILKYKHTTRLFVPFGFAQGIRLAIFIYNNNFIHYHKAKKNGPP